MPAQNQHNSRAKNETIKEGNAPEDGKSKPAKNRQKDKDARWTKKHERSYSGYKNHIGVGRRHKFVRRYVVSGAGVHDIQKFEDVLDAIDKVTDRHGKIVLGALGLGDLKLKLHRACVGQLFEAPIKCSMPRISTRKPKPWRDFRGPRHP